MKFHQTSTAFKESNMRKYIIAAVAAVMVMGASASAYAGLYDAWGIYHPTCTSVFYPGWGWQYVCG
jgi:hypothetical protein